MWQRPILCTLDSAIASLRSLCPCYESRSRPLLRGIRRNVEKQDAVVRRLAVIGDAVKGLPEDFRVRHPTVPWRDIAGARDIMIHEYFRVDLDLAWEMVRNDLPALAQNIRDLMRAEGLYERGAL